MLKHLRIIHCQPLQTNEQTTDDQLTTNNSTNTIDKFSRTRNPAPACANSYTFSNTMSHSNFKTAECENQTIGKLSMNIAMPAGMVLTRMSVSLKGSRENTFV